jgi:uncharacterized protein YceH (UPF0502 family)
MDLLSSEIRVLGCLLEKQRATPDQYPLTLNSLRLACNQSTNRDPVLDYDDDQVRDALRRLERRGMVRFAGGAGSRAPKYRHLLAEALPMDDAEQALMAVLMLRGGQTPGELKQRTERLHQFADLQEVHDALDRLVSRGLVLRLPRRRGQKEERFGQALGGTDSAAEHASAAEEDAPRPLRDSPASPGAPEAAERSEAAEQRLHEQPHATGQRSHEQSRGAEQRFHEQAQAFVELRQLLRRLTERTESLEGRLAALEVELGLQAEGAGEGVGVGEEGCGS